MFAAGIALSGPVYADDTDTSPPAAAADSTSTDTTTADTASELRTLLSQDATAPDGSAQLVIEQFYASRNFEPVWTGSQTALERGARVRQVLDHAHDQGLRSADYTTQLALWPDAPPPGPDAAKYEVALTAALLRYASDVRVGRIAPKDVYRDVGLPSQEFNAAASLANALNKDALDTFFDGLPPLHPAYHLLVAALADYRAIAAQGGWPTLTGNSEISLDGKDHRQAVLMRRLAFEDKDLASNPEPSLLDLHVAVLKYQRRNGLKDDGKVGPDMIKMLNVPASQRVRQIVANLERWRWVPRGLEPRYIFVNVPDQSLEYISDGKIILRTRVIIGKKTTPTPIIRTAVEAVVSNPSWDVPGDIASKTLLPHLRKSPNYLQARHIVVVDGPADDPYGTKINWRHVSASNLPYGFKQNPGGDNVLGHLMLDAPNDFDVYMHDTPNKKPFLSNTRELSNGCVRVEDIFPLASLALTGDPEQGEERLIESVSTGETQRLTLSSPLPVYMLYWTAVAYSDGSIGFRPDRYDRDGPLVARLIGTTRVAKAKTTPSPETK
jgi:murein L,D-transpeptidase YcbB/YkuD